MQALRRLPRLAGPRRADASDASDEGGFTLIEMIVAVGLSVVIFAALGLSLGGALRTVQVQKTRTMANEVATQGIEDLQRFKYSDLGICAAPTRPNNAPAPAGFTTVVTVNCTNAAIEEPCTPTVFSPALTTEPVPRESYACPRNGTTYTVSRYVAWGDASQTAKRLAVVVDWFDSAGRHEVSQQSSLRAPDSAAIIGTAPPGFSAAFPPTANPSTAWIDPTTGTLVTSNGSPSSLLLNATTTGLTAADQVFANILILDASGSPKLQEYSLTSTDGSNWSGTIPGLGSPNAPRLASGSQYVSYTLLRTTDGKANSTFSTPANKFCGNGTSSNTGGSCAISSTVPTISGSVSPTTIPLDPAGTMQAGSSLTISATTSNMTTSDIVTVTFQTQSGAQTETLLPSAACGTSPGTACSSWSKTITPTVGYRFPAGNQYLYFTAAQVSGSTAAAQSAFAVNFA